MAPSTTAEHLAAELAPDFRLGRRAEATQAVSNLLARGYRATDLVALAREKQALP